MKFKIIALLVSCLTFILSTQADVLELKNGKVLNGTYLGGTQQTIRFQVGDKVEVIPKDEALALTFSGSVSAATGSSTSYSRPSRDSQSSYSSRSARVKKITIPAGTSFMVSLVEGVNTKVDSAGTRFTTRLATDIVVDGVVVAEEGSLVYGNLQQARQAGRLTGRSSIQLALTEMDINNHLYPILTTDHIERGKDATKGTIATVGIGAIIGAIIDDDSGDGALKGAAIGSGVALITRGKPVNLPPNTLLKFQLAQPLTVMVPM